MRIITDSSALYSPEEGKQLGITVVPACTIIQNTVYRDYADISGEEFLSLIAQGAVPTSSQPSIGNVLDVYQAENDEALVLPLGDGLSGTYQNMLGARKMLESPEKVHVINTKTLAGPLWYLVQKAQKMRSEGFRLEEIKSALRKCIETSASFVIPKDFNFLRRSGRLTPVAAKIGTLLKIVPILTQTADKKQITLFGIKRTYKKAIQDLIEHFRKIGVNEHFLITISHGGAKEEAAHLLEQFRQHFASSPIRLFSLPPALICHGGPECILVQTIMM